MGEQVSDVGKGLEIFMGYRSRVGDFPGGPVVKNPTSHAGDKGLIPGQGSKIPNTPGQLSPRTTTREVHTLQRRPRAVKKQTKKKTTKKKKKQGGLKHGER